MSLLNNRYLILSELGKGGFGHTFLAEDAHLPSRRRCVIKQFKPANNDQSLLPRLQERFALEASILERIGEEHSQIPKLYAYFVEDEQFYLVQELIDGRTLGQTVRADGPLQSRVVKEIVSSLLGILDYLHARDIIHRDIKPDNIIYRKRDRNPVLIDFGTVKESVTTAYDQGGAPTSLVIGSPGYMPMEQAVGLAVYASDLYSLGWTAIYLLTGKQPPELVDRRTEENHWREFAPDVDYQLAEVIDKAVQRVSRDRYASAGEMLQALHPVLPETVLSPLPEPAQPQPATPSPKPPEPAKPLPETLPPPPIPAIPVSPATPSVETEFFIAPRDRWRIPFAFLVIYLPICLASLLSVFPRPVSLVWALGGVAQALLLRKYIHPIAWIAATTLGAFAASLMGANADIFNARANFGLFSIAEYVLAVGICQWLLLKRYVKHAKQWYLASILTVIAILLIFVFEINVRASIKEMTLNWLIAGLILGSAQAFILRRFRKKERLKGKN